MQLETPRLLLRPLRGEDAPQVYAYASQPQVGPSAGWKPHESLAETQQVMRDRLLTREDFFAVTLRATGEVIGSVSLAEDPCRRNPQARMLGYALSCSRWGMGYATEAAQAMLRYAFSDPQTALVTAYTYPFNRASQRVLEKCGFLREGVLRRCERRFDGVVLDCVGWSLLRGEYGI